MIPLIIDNNIRNQIKEVIKHSYNNIVPIRAMAENGKLKEGDANPIGDNDLHVVYIPVGFKVVFSVEDQGDGDNCLGLVRHLSMSISAHERVPHFTAVDTAIQEFGFDNPIYQCVLWGENFGDGTQTAINVLEPIRGWPEKDIINQLKNDFIKKFGQNVVETIDRMREHNGKTDGN